MPVEFTVTVPSAVTALARQRELGARKAAFWRRRAIRSLVLWLLTVVVLAVAITIGLLGHHWWALILIVLFLAGIALWRYSGPPECAVVYEQGLVYCIGRQQRSVRWDEARYLWRAPTDLAILPQADAVERSGAAEAPDMTGKSGRLIVQRVAGMDRLQQLIEAELQPRALARGRAQLAAGPQADYPPLAITATGVFVNPGSGTIQAPWAAVDSYGDVGGTVIVNAYVKDAEKGRVAKEWYRGLVADAAAAIQLMTELRPRPATAPTGAPAAPAAPALGNIAAEQDRLRKRAQKRRRSTVRRVTVFAVVVAGGAAITAIHLPSHGLGYAAVCGGQTASGAANYVPGAGPHPIDFEGGSDGFAGIPDDAGTLSGENTQWIPANAAAVQLVACVSEVRTSSVVASCPYDGGTSVPMDNVQYTISVYSAQNGSQLVAPHEIDGDDTTCPDSIETVNGQGPSAFYSTLTLSDVESVVSAVVDQ